MKHMPQKCGSILAIGIAAFLLSKIPTNAANEVNAFDAYRTPALSGSIQTWIYQDETFDLKSSKNRIFADDQEEGDLTSEIEVDGTVDTSTPGDYTVSYLVTDQDGNTTKLDTTVRVLEENAATEEDKAIQRILYTLPAAPHLTGIGFNRGYYHDRQNLGIWLPAGSELKVRIVNADEFGKDLDLQLKNNDDRKEKAVVVTEEEGVRQESAPDGSVKIPKNGDWVTVKNKNADGESNDSVPFIITPKDTTVQPVVEIAWNDAFEEIPYYRYQGNDEAQDAEEAFFDKWDETEAPFAIVEGSAATFLVPVADRNNIINKENESYPFTSIDDMLEWYAAFVKQYDAYSGLDFYAEEAYNQNVRAKFFIKANANGVGAAYYSGDHSANNGEQLGGYLARNWVCLHEFGHGYEGSIANQENPFVETTNNIMGYYFEPSYRAESDNGWMLYNFSGSKTERYAALGNLAKERRDKANSFAEIIRRQEEPEDDKYYNVTLFMFTNMLDKLGPEETVKAMHTQYRKYCYENGKTMSSSDAIIDSFSCTGGYNVIPYFDGWYIRPSEKLEKKIYDMDLPMLYYLKDLVTDQSKAESENKIIRDEAEAEAAAEAERIRSSLGLSGIYSLVSTEELAGTGYTSQIDLQLEIDDILQIQGKDILIKNGNKIVKTVPVTGKNISIEIPIGIYEVELPMPRAAVYRYGHEYLIASKGKAKKEFVYSRISGNPLIDDVLIGFYGLGDQKVANIAVSTDDHTLTWNVESVEPHSYFGEKYIGIRVFDAEGKEIYSQTLNGNETAGKLTKVLNFPIGSKLEIYHAESYGRLKFASNYSKENLSVYQLPRGTTEVTYVMTERGLMQEEWMTDEDKQMNVYQEILNAYSKCAMSDMTQEDMIYPEKFYKEKMTASWAYEFLDEEAQKEYCMSYGALVSQSPDSYQGYILIDSSKLRGFADSESDRQDEKEGAALDGNPDTFWHSNYGNGVRPNLKEGTNNSYTILLEENTDIGRLEYLPRSGGANGTILTYELFYSTTESGDDFQKIKIVNNTWEANGNKKSIDFYAPNARRIKISALSTGGADPNNHVSAAEFYLYERYETTVKDTYLSDLYPDSWDVIGRDQNGNREDISLLINDRARVFEKGIGLVTDTTAVWDLTGKGCDIFTGYLGIDASQQSDQQAVVEIYGDGTLLYRSKSLIGGHSAEFVYLNIEGIEKLEIKALSDEGEMLVSIGDAKLKRKQDLAALTLKTGESASVVENESFMPQNFGKVIWESEDTDVAVVGKDGVITATGEGRTTVKGYFEAKIVSCTVVVESNEEEEIKRQIQNVLSDARNAYLKGEAAYTSESFRAFLTAYEAIRQSGAVTDLSQIQQMAEELADAINKLEKVSLDHDEDSLKIEENQIYESGDYLYRIISISKKTAAVAGVKNAGLKTIKIEKTAVIGKESYQVVSIDASAFAKNKTITKVTVSADIESIGKKAFMKCVNLKTVTIASKKLKKIDSKAFYNCKKLKKVTLKTKKLTKIGKNAFGKIHKKGAVKVPKNKYSAYQKKFSKVTFKK